MLAEKYLLLLETLRKGLPNWRQTHPDGSPRVVSTAPHIPVRLPTESQPTGKLMGAEPGEFQRRDSPLGIQVS
jgi:hypothetical protein